MNQGNNLALRQMSNRLGFNNKTLNTNSTLDLQSERLAANGGFNQQDRMIFDKKRSLDRALKYSYQACDIKSKNKIARALINSNRLTQDYDEKIVSIPFEDEIGTGDVIEWIGTDTHWLIYMQQLTEKAYYKGNIRKCNYEISLPNGETTYAAIYNNNPQSLSTLMFHGIAMDVPNYKLIILLPKTADNLEYFQRYFKFYLKGDKTCWRVESVDSITTDGIIQVYADEYYSNPQVDDIENGIVDANAVKIEDPNTDTENDIINGESIINPKVVYMYQYTGAQLSTWSIEDIDNKPIRYNVSPDGSKIKLIWYEISTGEFILANGDNRKKIIVKSLI